MTKRFNQTERTTGKPRSLPALRKRLFSRCFQRAGAWPNFLRAALFGALAFFLLAACGSRASEAVAEPPQSAPPTANTNARPEKETPSPMLADASNPPEAYRKNCAECHGAKGEGSKKSPELVGVTTRAEDPYTDADLLNIINDAKGFGLSAKMPSFRQKLTEEEKQQIIMWLKALK